MMQAGTVKPLRTNPGRPGIDSVSAPNPQQLPPENGYRIGHRLDRGGPDEVYEASHPAQPGRLAIKLIRRAVAAGPKPTEAFRRDLARAAGLRHPHNVHVIETGVLAVGVPYLVMEYLGGQSLRAHLARRGPVPAMEAVPWIKAVAAALSAAHATGVIHGGLRPSKVFLADASGYEHGFVKLLDFCSWHLGIGAGRGPDGEVVAYTAPELQGARAEGVPVDGSADQFSLAAIAYRLLTGRDAFVGGTVGNVLSRVLHEPPRPPSALAPCDPMVEQVVLRGLAKRPGERFPAVLDFANAFEQAALSSLPVVTQTVSRSQVMTTEPLSQQQPRQSPPQAQPVYQYQQAPAPQPHIHHVTERGLMPVISHPAQVIHVGHAGHAGHADHHGAQVTAEQPDELSEQFFAEGQRQEDAHRAGVPARATSRRKTYDTQDHLPSVGALEPFDSMSKLMRVPRRRWPGRLLALLLLAGGAAGFWRSELPYAAEVRAWVTSRLPL
jgi:eukaryotic-like serine/threonine-protein kinase